MSNRIGLDTNILARYYVASEEGDSATQSQCELARKLIESDRALFVAKTVLLELEWVLRGYYKFSGEEIQEAKFGSRGFFSAMKPEVYCSGITA